MNWFGLTDFLMFFEHLDQVIHLIVKFAFRILKIGNNIGL